MHTPLKQTLNCQSKEMIDFYRERLRKYFDVDEMSDSDILELRNQWLQQQEK